MVIKEKKKNQHPLTQRNVLANLPLPWCAFSVGAITGKVPTLVALEAGSLLALLRRGLGAVARHVATLVAVVAHATATSRAAEASTTTTTTAAATATTTATAEVAAPTTASTAATTGALVGAVTRNVAGLVAVVARLESAAASLLLLTSASLWAVA